MTHKGFVIVGNWKMNPENLSEAKAIFSSISKRAAKAKKTTVIVAPPAVFMSELSNKKTPVFLSAQDVAFESSGAFTGSISGSQMKDAGAEYAIIGHSEKRSSGDTEEIVALKVNQAISAGLKVIVCVGENERDNSAHYFETIRRQVLSVVNSIDKKSAKSIIIAYEPVWAVGKDYEIGPKPGDIHEMSIYIKKVATEALGKKVGLNISVIYGGSVDLEDAKLILKESMINGLLIGRQSLDPKAFGAMIDYADSI